MEFDPATILPAPPEHLEALEDYYEVQLPEDFKRFVLSHNGAIPRARRFDAAGAERLIERFLPVLADAEDHPLGWLELEVVASQLDSRLTDDPDGETVTLIPIATLLPATSSSWTIARRRSNRQLACGITNSQRTSRPP